MATFQPPEDLHRGFPRYTCHTLEHILVLRISRARSAFPSKSPTKLRVLGIDSEGSTLSISYIQSQPAREAFEERIVIAQVKPIWVIVADAVRARVFILSGKKLEGKEVLVSIIACAQ